MVSPSCRGDTTQYLLQTRKKKSGSLSLTGNILSGVDIKKRYTKIMVQSMRKNLKLRHQLSGLLLFPLCLILMVFPPLAAISVVLWIRTFSLKQQSLSRNESLLLLIVVLSVLFISTLIFLMFDESALAVYFDTSYAIGIFISILTFAAFIVKS
jgi:hypothetical protein